MFMPMMQPSPYLYPNIPPMMNRNFMNQPPIQELVEQEKTILQYLEYYFSLDNLNRDYFMRTKIDEEGFIDAQEIVNFNKMKVKGVSMDKIAEVLNETENSLIESKIEGERLLLRNRDWDVIREKLLPIEYLLQQKKMNKTSHNNTLNYVGTQNNFYFNSNQQGYAPNMPNPYWNMSGNIPSYPQNFPPTDYENPNNND